MLPAADLSPPRALIPLPVLLATRIVLLRVDVVLHQNFPLVSHLAFFADASLVPVFASTNSFPSFSRAYVCRALQAAEYFFLSRRILFLASSLVSSSVPLSPSVFVFPRHALLLSPGSSVLCTLVSLFTLVPLALPLARALFVLRTSSPSPGPLLVPRDARMHAERTHETANSGCGCWPRARCTFCSGTAAFTGRLHRRGFIPSSVAARDGCLDPVDEQSTGGLYFNS